MIECPKCKSHAIVNQRIDSDWHSNSATSVNNQESYSPREWKQLENAEMQMGVNVLICLKCYHNWNP